MQYILYEDYKIIKSRWLFYSKHLKERIKMAKVSWKVKKIIKEAATIEETRKTLMKKEEDLTKRLIEAMHEEIGFDISNQGLLLKTYRSLEEGNVKQAIYQELVKTGIL